MSQIHKREAPIPDVSPPRSGGAFRESDRIAQAMRPPEIWRSTLISQGLHRRRGSVEATPPPLIGELFQMERSATIIAPFNLNHFPTYHFTYNGGGSRFREAGQRREIYGARPSKK